jgi:hypothetical protein
VIDDVDRTLEKLLELEFRSPLPFDLSFAIPDHNFAPISSTKTTLNCYLYDIHENRELRDTRPSVHRDPQGLWHRHPAPARVRVSYCLTAWSPATHSPTVHPAIDEHALLGAVLRALLRHPELPPSVLVGTLMGQEPAIPTTAGSPDTGRVSWDFWSALGAPLRPSLDFTMTFALAFDAEQTAVSLTTTRLQIGTGEPRHTVGGVVWSAAVPREGIPAAWVRLDPPGKTFVADAAGRFVIGGLSQGNYTLTARAVGYQEGIQDIAVPSTGVGYDLVLTKL